MVVDKIVIVAGIGSQRGVSATEVVAAVDAALNEYGLKKSALALLATARMKQDEAGIVAAAARFHSELDTSAPTAKPEVTRMKSRRARERDS